MTSSRATSHRSSPILVRSNPADQLVLCKQQRALVCSLFVDLWKMITYDRANQTSC